MCSNELPKKCNHRRFVTIPQAAEELGVHERTVWRRIEEKEILAYDFGGATRIKREDLDAYIERCRR